jgi:hypothetical protein
VGKGNHSVNHIQKIKPRVEQICQELNLQYVTEQNEGRMYINLQGGPAVMPPAHGHGGQQNHGGQSQQNTHQGGYQGGNQQQGYNQSQNQGYNQNQNGNGQNNDEMEELAMKVLPKILKKLDGCCSIM